MSCIFEDYDRELEEATKKELEKEAAEWAALPQEEKERLLLQREEYYASLYTEVAEPEDYEEDEDEDCDD